MRAETHLSETDRSDAPARHDAPPTNRHDIGGVGGVARTYERLAPLYDLVFGRFLDAGRVATATAARAVGPRSLLEVGVGSGLTLSMYPADVQIVGIDLSEPMLARARRRAARLPDRDIRLLQMNAEQMDFADDSFDCVTIPYVLSVTPHVDRLVAEVRRVCKPGGTILVVNHFRGRRFWRPFETIGRPIANRLRFDSDFSYEKHILAYDWEVLSSRPVNLLGLSTMVALRN